MQTNRDNTLPAGKSEHGFSAIEMLIATVLLMAVLGVVVKGMTDMQRRSFSETSKMDAVQDTRDFIDQMVRDVHDVGYPPARSIGVVGGVANTNPYCTDAQANGVVNAAIRNNISIACGIVSYSPTSLVYEADLDGTGTVSVVFMNLVANGGNCPCILQRGVVTKQQWANNNAIVPQYFTTVNGVMNSGNGAGAATFPLVVPGTGNYAAYATSDVFDAYDANAVPITVACTLATAPDCSQIRSLQITANVAPAYADPTSKQFPVYSITSKARINF
jgi:type II secretory pathway pseudopilin PulG